MSIVRLTGLIDWNASGQCFAALGMCRMVSRTMGGIGYDLWKEVKANKDGKLYGIMEKNN